MSIPYRNPIVHDEGKSKFTGDYELTDQALKNYKIARDKFGTTEVILPDNSSFIVKDYQYRLEDGSIGMHFVPVNNNMSILSPNNELKSGDYFIDDFLRKKMKLKPDEPIYAFVNYFHPEQNKGTIKHLLTSKELDKVEIGFTHLGAYYGKGYTTNAPLLYHAHKFGVTGEANETVFGYPANVQIVSMQGVPQGTLNKNLQYVDTCLNSGVMFPDKSPLAYKNSKFRQMNINTALMFYRDWINFEGYLRKDDTWYTYCAAHKTVVATIALNLPHNLTSFKVVYGDVEGADLFAKFKLFYNNIVGPDPGFLPVNETYFTPLWKLEGFKVEEIRPFSLTEYNAYESARIAGKVNSFNGKKPLNPDQATGWPAQTSASIIFDIVQIYADMLDAGPILSSAIILAFMDIIDDRMGINKLQYLFHAMSIMDNLMVAHASMHAANDPDNYLEKTYEQLYMAYGGKTSVTLSFTEELKKINSVKGNPDALEAFIKSDPIIEAIAAWVLLGVVENWDTIIKAGIINPIDAYVTFIESSKADLANAEAMHITDPNKVEYSTPPAITHLIGNEMHEPNKFVTVNEVCTVIDSSEAQFKTS